MEPNNENNISNEKKITVVSGDGSDLDISKVYDHLNVDSTTKETSEKNNIIIPTEKKNKD